MKTPEEIAKEIADNIPEHPLYDNLIDGDWLIEHIAAAIREDRQWMRGRVDRLCTLWSRYWNWLYGKDAKRGRVMYHQIGTAVWAVGQKILDDEEPPPIG